MLLPRQLLLICLARQLSALPQDAAAQTHTAAAAVQGRFDSDTFTADVVEVAKKLVPLTVTLWNKVSIKMLPTPAKFHYLFNMRELSKVLPCLPVLTACIRGRILSICAEQLSPKVL